eukprot:376417-Pyramimonas_sp.AAC.1
MPAVDMSPSGPSSALRGCDVETGIEKIRALIGAARTRTRRRGFRNCPHRRRPTGHTMFFGDGALKVPARVGSIGMYLLTAYADVAGRQRVRK